MMWRPNGILHKICSTASSAYSWRRLEKDMASDELIKLLSKFYRCTLSQRYERVTQSAIKPVLDHNTQDILVEPDKEKIEDHKNRVMHTACFIDPRFKKSLLSEPEAATVNSRVHEALALEASTSTSQGRTTSTSTSSISLPPPPPPNSIIRGDRPGRAAEIDDLNREVKRVRFHWERRLMAHWGVSSECLVPAGTLQITIHVFTPSASSMSFIGFGP
ncbi:hypothetical protein NHX12_019427 [Muraenolepis orangiensis]|uniref:Uncharacterized protein n=1 Tax=Muraenolepis orangiensis TaxID=630683 RepID=A0A9Q0EWP3_9TELE|nr:hypothetical protein NHX12_019427 [Muraenolepis orangiensis]